MTSLTVVSGGHYVPFLITLAGIAIRALRYR